MERFFVRAIHDFTDNRFNFKFLISNLKSQISNLKSHMRAGICALH